MNYLKYLVVGIIIVGANKYLGSAGPLYVDENDIAVIKGPWLYEVQNQIPEEEIAPRGNAIFDNSISDVSATHSIRWIEKKEEEGNGNPGGQIQWGTDRLVRSGSSNLSWISLSHSSDRPNKTNYVTFVRYVSGTGLDTVSCFASDDGKTWNWWFSILPSTNEISQTEVLVGRGTNPWVYVFFVSYNYGQANTGALWLLRIRADGSAYNFIQIATPGDSTGRFVVDIDKNENLYLAYLKQAGATTWNLYLTRSTDQGATWQTPILVASGNRKYPEIAIGAPSHYFYISYVVDDSIIRIGRYANWANWTFVDIETDADQEYYTSIAASRDSSTLTAWCLYRNYHSSTNVYDIHYAYTTDGGSNWTFGVWPPMNFAYGNVAYPWVETAFDYPVNLCVALGTTIQTFDSIVTVWANAGDPSSWHDRGVINDYDATTLMPNKIDLNIRLGGTTILYRQYASGNIWFDYWWNVGIKEAMKDKESLIYSLISKNGNLLLKFNLPYGKNLRIDVYSPSGRNVNRIERYFDRGNHSVNINLPGKGIYFLRFSDKRVRLINIK